MNRKGFTLVEIMIVVAIIALLAAIAIPNLLEARKTANDAAAKANLRTLSTAAETYATANEGTYPAVVGTVHATDPAQNTGLAKYAPSVINICTGANGAAVGGFKYTCTLAASGYTLTAAPVTTGTTGTKTFTIKTGGVLTES
jgi:type IV pilus assembly protein PilA